jgi:hypothetical protein
VLKVWIGRAIGRAGDCYFGAVCLTFTPIAGRAGRDDAYVGPRLTMGTGLRITASGLGFYYIKSYY